MRNKSHPLKHWFRTLEPKLLAMMNGPAISKFKPWIDKHDIFSFTREPLARGLAFGLFCSLIPGPFQMPATLLACILWRGNIVAGFGATLLSNPITIVPLYLLAYQIGSFFLPTDAALVPLSGITTAHFGSTDWFMAVSTWLQSLGWPLVIGLLILGINLAGLGYALVQIAWLWPVHRRKVRMNRKK